MGWWRDAWAEAQGILPAPLRASERRYHVTGPQVVERRGIEEHRPVRPPQKWKEVVIFGRKVFVRGHDAADCLIECPDCAALVVGDPWAKETHMKACGARLVAAELAVTEDAQ